MQFPASLATGLHDAHSPRYTPPTHHHCHNTMACSLIPSGIRLRIFEFCPDVPTAASLAQISKPFNDTWMSYKKPICLDILERSIECYEDARNLVTQDMFESHVTTEVLEQSFEAFTSCILANAKVLNLTILSCTSRRTLGQSSTEDTREEFGTEFLTE